MAEKYIGILTDKGYKVSTQLQPAGEFWEAEDYIGIEVDDSLGSMYLHTCDVMALAVTEEDTLLVSVVVRYRVLTLFSTTAQTYHIALSQTLTTDSVYPVRVHTCLLSYVCWQVLK
jgi:hypothetical protein